jgi:osmotically inducible protein OsmC
MERVSTAVWQGDGKTGSGALSLQSGVLKDQPYSFNSRFIDPAGKAGTNPEELLAAAHAGCFAMALAFKLAAAGFKPRQLRARATVKMGMIDGEQAITGIDLDVQADVPGIDAPKLQAIAEDAKSHCPLSKALAATPIGLTAALGPA